MLEHHLASTELRQLYRDLSTRCRAAILNHELLSELTLNVLDNKEHLNQLLFIELLIQPIEHFKKLDTPVKEAYCKAVYRIVQNTDVHMGPTYPLFQTSVTLQLIELWADKYNWHVE